MNKCHRFLLGLIAAAAFVASGVALPSSAFALLSPIEGGCVTNSDCGFGQECSYGACQPCLSDYRTGECLETCRYNSDCAFGEYCDRGSCQDAMCGGLPYSDRVIYLPMASANQITSNGSLSDLVGMAVQPAKNDSNKASGTTYGCNISGNNCRTGYTSKLIINEGANGSCGSEGGSDCPVYASSMTEAPLYTPVVEPYGGSIYDTEDIAWAEPSIDEGSLNITSSDTKVEVDGALHNKTMYEDKYMIKEVLGTCNYTNTVALRVSPCSC